MSRKHQLLTTRWLVQRVTIGFLKTSTSYPSTCVSPTWLKQQHTRNKPKVEMSSVRNVKVYLAKMPQPFCAIVASFFASDCKRDYERLLDDEDLEFIDLASYEKGEFKLHSPPPKCPLHKKQDLALFCDDCETLICLFVPKPNTQNTKKSSIEDIAQIKKNSFIN